MKKFLRLLAALILSITVSAQTLPTVVVPVQGQKLTGPMDANSQPINKAISINFGTANDVTLARTGVGALTLTGSLTVTGAVTIPSLTLGSMSGLLSASSGVVSPRVIQVPAEGLTLANPGGIAGNPTFALANDLAAVESMTTTGVVFRTASDVWVARTLAGTANQITVTDGNGINAPPTFSLPVAVITPGSLAVTTTLSVTGHTTFEGVTSTGATGTGNLVYSTSPALVTPALGTPTALVLTNATGLPLTTGVTGILPGANGGTGVANTGKTLTLGGNVTTSGAYNLTATLSGNTTVTLPTTGTLVGSDDTGTVTNTMLAGSITNAKLGNSSITLGSTALNLGSTITTVAGLTLTSPVLGNATATSITAPASTDLTLSGGSSGASLVLGSGANGAVVLTPGSMTTANEYFTVNAATLTAALPRDTFAIRGLLTINNSTVDYHSSGVLGQVVTSASSGGLNQWLAGVYGYFKHNGTTAMSEAIGVTGVMTTSSTGNVTEAAAFKSQIDQQASTGRFITARHFYAPPFTNTSAATKPTYLAAFEAGDQGIDGGLATTVYAFKSNGDTPSLLGPTTVSSLATSSTIRTAGVTDATGADTGMIRSLGGISAAKQVWVGTRLVIDNSGTTNAKGIDFGDGAYIFRNQSGGIRITTTNQLYVDGDVVPTPTATYDIGGSSLKWRNAHFSGTINTGAVSSAAGSNLVIGTGTFGTALTFTSTTGSATFAGAVTAPSLTAPASTDLTLSGGSSGASLVLGQNTSGVSTLTAGSAATGYANKILTVKNGAGTSHITTTGDGRVYVGPDVGYNSLLTVRRTTGNGVTELLNLDDADGLKVIFSNPTSTVFSQQIGGSVGSFNWGNSGVNNNQMRLNTASGNLLIGTTTDMSGSGGLKVAGTTAATSTTTGALIVAGGAGVSGAGYFGGTMNVTGQSNFGADLVSTAAGTFRLTANSTNQVNIGNNGANTSALVVIPSGSGTSLTLNGVTSATFAGAVTSGGSATITGGTATLNLGTETTTGARIVQFGSTFNSGSLNFQNGVTVLASLAATGLTSNVGFRAGVGSGPTAVDYGWSGASGLYSPTANNISIANNNARVANFSTTSLNLDYTTSASSSTVGALTIGNGTAATNVAIGGGNINAGGIVTASEFRPTGGPADWSQATLALNSNTTYLNAKYGNLGYLSHNASGILGWQSDRVTIIPSTASTGVGTGALQVAGGIYAGAASVFSGVSNPGSGTSSERFGDAASTSTFGQSVAVGKSAAVTGALSAAIGNLASSADGGVAIGYNASTTAQYGTAVGRSTTAAGSSVAVGSFSNAAGSSIALGYSQTAATGDIVLGIGNAASEVYIGQGKTAAADYGTRLQAASGVSAAVAGGTLRIAGGKGGDAATAGGSVIIQTASAGTGTTLTDRLTISPTGTATFAGDVTIGGTGFLSAARSVYTTGAVATPIANSAVMDWSGGFARFWGVGADAATAGGLKLVVSATDTSPFIEALTIATTGAATFAGAVTAPSLTGPTSLTLTATTGNLNLNMAAGADVNINGTNGNIYATLNPGQVLYARSSQDSTGGATTKASPTFAFRGSYWTGAASQDVTALINLQTSTTAANNYLSVGQWDFAGNENLKLYKGTLNVVLPATEASTGVGTGALQVAGGIYAGAASVLNTTTLKSDTGLKVERTSSDELLQIFGGATFGISVTKTSGTFRPLAFYTSDSERMRIAVDGTLSTQGAATFAGAVTATGNFFQGASGSGAFFTNRQIYNDAANSFFTIYGGNDATSFFRVYGNTHATKPGQTEITSTSTVLSSTTASTGVGTGALQVAGGIYAGAASYMGGNLTVASAGTSTFGSGTNREPLSITGASTTDTIFHIINTSTNGADWQLRSVGEAGSAGGVAGDLVFFCGGPFNASALKFNGTTGAATFAGAVNAAGTISSGSTTSYGTSKLVLRPASDDANQLLTVLDSTGATPKFVISNNGVFTTVQPFGIGMQPYSTARLALQGGGTGSNTNLVLMNSSSAITFSVTDAGSVTANSLTVAGTTASTSTTTGSLINAGGFGNAGAAFIGGKLIVGDVGNSAEALTVSTTSAVGTFQRIYNTATNKTAGMYFTNTTGDVYITNTGTTNDTIVGSIAGSLALRSPTQVILSANGGTNAHLTIANTGAATFAGAVTISANPGGVAGLLTISTGAVDTTSAIRFSPISTKYNWLAGAQINTNNTFEITPSTAVGGSTFSTPALTIAGATGAATFAGAVTVNAISGITALAAGTQLATFESSVNGAAVELITKGKNSTGTARQANMGINRFADDVWSLSNGTTEHLRVSLTTGAATFAGAVTANGQLIAKGTATNDSAATGYIGEYVSSTLASGSAVSLTTNTYSNITSISLTAGDWDVSAMAGFVQGATTVVSYYGAGITATSASAPAEANMVQGVSLTGAGNFTGQTAVPVVRVSVASTTTYYLTTISGFTTSTNVAFGKLQARRVR